MYSLELFLKAKCYKTAAVRHLTPVTYLTFDKSCKFRNFEIRMQLCLKINKILRNLREKDNGRKSYHELHGRLKIYNDVIFQPCSSEHRERGCVTLFRVLAQ